MTLTFELDYERSERVKFSLYAICQTHLVQKLLSEHTNIHVHLTDCFASIAKVVGKN